jgi:RNA polymerase sigma-70 factor (ECF subfamily)
MWIRTKGEERRMRFEILTLTRPHLDALHRFALHKVRSTQHAEDLVQETCLKAYRAFERFEPGTEYRSWLFRILINTIVDFQRRVSREAKNVSLETESRLSNADGEAESKYLTDPERQMMARSLVAQLHTAVDKLPSEWREVLLLNFVEGFSYQQIAQILGCPIGTVMSRLYRARKSLREHLAGHIEDADDADLKRSSVRGASSKPIDLIRHRAKVWSNK